MSIGCTEHLPCSLELDCLAYWISPYHPGWVHPMHQALLPNPVTQRILLQLHTVVVINQSSKQLMNQQNNQSMNQSMNQASNQTTNESTKESMREWINEQMSEWMNESTNQSIDQSSNKWINKTINQWINQPINRSIKQQTNQQINKSMNQAVTSVAIQRDNAACVLGTCTDSCSEDLFLFSYNY